MIGWFVWGAMNLAWTIEYAFQAGWAQIVLFERLLPLAGLGATESGVDCRVIGIVIVASALVFVASGPAVSIPGFGSARFTCTITATGEPAVFAHAKAGHECYQGCHGLRLLLDEVSGEPFVANAMFKGR